MGSAMIMDAGPFYFAIPNKRLSSIVIITILSSLSYGTIKLFLYLVNKRKAKRMQKSLTENTNNEEIN